MNYRVEIYTRINGLPKKVSKAWFENTWTAFSFFYSKSFFVVTNNPNITKDNDVALFKNEDNRLICTVKTRSGWDWYPRIFKLETGCTKEEREGILGQLLPYHMWNNRYKQEDIKAWHEEVIKRLR